ncbi:MAG: hypothetical protein KJ915_09930 [Candidatus Omnitrophica bacterium]|nr:hypothetical protein [Candidatus Omnitrophota bacterium]
MKSERLRKIEAENAKLERETPFNFCDRWCARCVFERQIRCKLYQDELEQKLTCIAHGKDEDDLEITEQVIFRQFSDMDKAIENLGDEYGIESDFEQSECFDAKEEIANLRKSIKDNALVCAADEYFKRAHEFLKDNFYDKKFLDQKLSADFETVNWYHTLLTVKLHRALSSFGDDADTDFEFYDAVAQFAVCRKAIEGSLQALRSIQQVYPGQLSNITQLLALLNNISNRIEKHEEMI